MEKIWIRGGKIQFMDQGEKFYSVMINIPDPKH
jgi:hypothetical protein